MNCVRALHACGYVHLDIKPDNILVNSNDFSHPLSSLLTLIDFSVSKKFQDEDGKHIELCNDQRFDGNFAFSSKYQMLGISNNYISLITK